MLLMMMMMMMSVAYLTARRLKPGAWAWPGGMRAKYPYLSRNRYTQTKTRT